MLLAGYFLNVVSFERFHQAVHHHEHADLHTEEAEEDACHRAIYHGESSHDCEHKSHLLETEIACDLCKVTVSRFHFNSATVQASNQPNQFAHIQATSTAFLDSNCSLVYSPRGPPAIS